MKQYTLLTNSGINKLLKTASDGSKIALKEIVVSDFDGELSESITTIPNEKYRGAINAVTIDENDNNILDVDAIIPPDVGGFYIKTAGIYCDDGSLFAVARLADTYKPLLNEGSSKDITLNFKLQIANASESIILKVDNNIVLATRKWCEKMFLKIKDKIDAYTKQESDDKFLKKTDKIDAYTNKESDEKFAQKDDLPPLATETKVGITKLKNIINAKQTDVAVTEKAVSDAIEAIKNSVAGTAKLSAHGYIKLPGGLILQWTWATSGGTQFFPITFPHECFFVSATHTAQQGSTEAVGLVSTRSFSNSRATFWSSQSGSGAMISGQCLLIFAIGW